MCKKQKWLKPHHTQLIFVTTPPIDIWPTNYRTFCRRNLDSLLYSIVWAIVWALDPTFCVAGWTRIRFLCSYSGWVQWRSLHPRRLYDTSPQWDEILHQVRGNHYQTQTANYPGTSTMIWEETAVPPSTPGDGGIGAALTLVWLDCTMRQAET